MRTQIREACEAFGKTGEASLSFEIEGKTYVRRFRKTERLILLGAGHIAQPLCRYAADLGFLVTVIDDRPDFASYDRFPEATEVICDSFENALDKVGINPADYVAVITRGHRAVWMQSIHRSESTSMPRPQMRSRYPLSRNSSSTDAPILIMKMYLPWKM